MHERRIVQGLVNAAEEAARGRKVVAIKMWLGALSHVTPGVLAEHLDDLGPESVLVGADLECEVSTDSTHPDALDVRLVSVAVEDG